MKKKKKKREPQSKSEFKRLLIRIVAIPAIAVVGMFLIAGIIGTLLDLSMTVTYTLAGVGIVAFLTYYFRNDLRRLLSGFL